MSSDSSLAVCYVPDAGKQAETAANECDQKYAGQVAYCDKDETPIDTPDVTPFLVVFNGLHHRFPNALNQDFGRLRTNILHFSCWAFHECPCPLTTIWLFMSKPMQ